MGKKIRIDQLAVSIVGELEKYSTTTGTNVKECARKITKKACNELKQSSPKKSGKYSKGWKTTIVAENATSINIVIHETVYQLTHLLEKGHAKRGGGRVNGIPHIAPIEQKYGEELLKEVEKIL